MTLEPLSSTTAVFLLVDHQTGVFERVVKAPPRDQVEANVLRFARAAALLEIPTILTTSEEKGENGALLPALEQILPEAYASASTATGSSTRWRTRPSSRRSRRPDGASSSRPGLARRCAGWRRALHARRDGYHVAFVARPLSADRGSRRPSPVRTRSGKPA